MIDAIKHFYYLVGIIHSLKGVPFQTIIDIVDSIPKDKQISFMRWANQTEFFLPKTSVYLEQGDNAWSGNFLMGDRAYNLKDGQFYTGEELKLGLKGKWKAVYYQGGMHL